MIFSVGVLHWQSQTCVHPSGHMTYGMRVLIGLLQYILISHDLELCEMKKDLLDICLRNKQVVVGRTVPSTNFAWSITENRHGQATFDFVGTMSQKTMWKVPNPMG